MAKLDRPLYGEYATGTLARALSFRHTFNPPDIPGETVISWGTVCKIPFMSCKPTACQIAQRLLYASAVNAWHSLTEAEQEIFMDNPPDDLTGFNFFIRLYLLPNLAYFGFCVFGSAFFQLAPGYNQPADIDYDINFPAAVDEFPTLQDGAHSPQAWLFNRLFDMMRSIEDYLI